MNKKHLIILLPLRDHGPVGGYKVVYEYANRLVADNFDVTLVYQYDMFYKTRSFIQRMVRVLKYVIIGLTSMYKTRWFNLDKKVKTKWVLTLHAKVIPTGDMVMATAYQTAEFLMGYDGIENRKKLYLIQGYESWFTDEDSLLKTWHAPFTKIVISPWLLDIADKLNVKAELIENGFNFDEFKTIIKPEDRNKYSVLIIYHKAPHKGFQDGLEAILEVKRQYPQLQVDVFGSFPRPDELPEWINFTRNPDNSMHNALYNQSAIFLAPSHSEGWGLPVGEAMLCSCAVVCTDNGGHTTMAKNEETALTAPVKNPKALADQIIRLIENDELRYRLSKEGHKQMKKYSWDRSYEKFRTLIHSI